MSGYEVFAWDGIAHLVSRKTPALKKLFKNGNKVFGKQHLAQLQKEVHTLLQTATTDREQLMFVFGYIDGMEKALNLDLSIYL